MSARIAHYRILYRDIDSMGYLYYGRYLALYELGRVEWMRAEGWSYREFEERTARMLPVSQAWCRYHAPLRYDDLAEIHTWIENWSFTTVRFGHRVARGGTQDWCASGEVELGCVDRQTRRPARLPAGFQEMLQRCAGERFGRKRGL